MERRDELVVNDSTNQATRLLEESTRKSFIVTDWYSDQENK